MSDPFGNKVTGTSEPLDERNANYGAIPTGDAGHSVNDELGRRGVNTEDKFSNLYSATKQSDNLGGYREASQKYASSEKPQTEVKQQPGRPYTPSGPAFRHDLAGKGM